MQSIRARLLAVVLLAALIPALPLSLVVRNLLDRSLNPDTHGSLADGLEAGLDGSRDELRRLKETFRLDVDRSWSEAPGDGGVLADGGSPRPGAPLPDSLLATAPAPGELLRRGGWLLTTRLSSDGNEAVFGRELPPELVERAGALTEGLSLLRTLKLERRAILRSYVLPFLLAYATLLAVALGVAAFAAGRLTHPLTALAAGARRVGAGELDVRVDARAGGEVGDVVDAFNVMTGELAVQRRRLARLEKMAAWRGMSRVLAHEIKNPLTPILLAVQQTRRSYDGDDERFASRLEECESIVDEEVTGLRDLVRSFSDFARMPSPEPAVESVPELLDDLARLYGDRLAVDAAEAPVVWTFDAAQVRRALVNLVDNGLAARRRAGRDAPVRMSAATVDGALRLVVSDEGDGIPAEHAETVFEPDFTTGDGGMGLGLPIVKGIAEAHGGDVVIIASSPEGTTMAVVLPSVTLKEPAS